MLQYSDIQRLERAIVQRAGAFIHLIRVFVIFFFDGFVIPGLSEENV